MFEDSYLSIGDLKLRYKYWIGDPRKSTLVLLHGFSFTADTWEEIGLLDFLKENNVTFYALDMPGFGKSTGKRVRDGFKAADILDQFLEKLGVEKPVLLGPSMGGRYALSYAVKYAEKVKALILVAPAGLDDERIKSSLHKLDMPVLIFWGDKDKVFPLKLGYELDNRLPNSRLVVCEGAPHPCYLQSTDLFKREVLVFLDSLRH